MAMNAPLRALAAAGAWLAAIAVALAAYASHAAVPDTRERLFLAALFAFGHGVALAAFAPHAVRRLERLALTGLLAGTLLFAGSLAGAVLAGTSTAAAPIGGGLLIASWLLLGLDRLRG